MINICIVNIVYVDLGDLSLDLIALEIKYGGNVIIMHYCNETSNEKSRININKNAPFAWTQFEQMGFVMEQFVKRKIIK